MLIELLNIVAASAAAAVAVPCGILSVELASALLPGRGRSNDGGDAAPPFGVLVPAHNEAQMIGRTVASLREQLRHGDRLLVVADNCTDDTAAIARVAGAEVIERTDAALRGKGYALDCGVRYLEADHSGPPEVLIIVDADVRVRPGSLAALARQAGATGRAAQSIYVLQPPAGGGTRDMISHIAFTVRNHIRPMGLMRLAGVCPLFGAGMAFPFATIAKAPLASGNIVEDLALALDLATDGAPPMLCPAARVDGELVPLAHADNLKQRRRWEHGHLRTISSHAPRVLIRSLLRGRFNAAALAIDVMVAPLSLLLMASLVTTAACGLAAMLGASILPFAALASSLLLTVGLLTASWCRYAECQHPLRPLAAIPAYVLGKLPLYLSFLTKAESNWNRAARPSQAIHTRETAIIHPAPAAINRAA